MKTIQHIPKALLYILLVSFSCFSSLAFPQCDLPSPYDGNTGANMTVMLTPTFISSLNISEENAFIVAISTDGLVIGSVFLYDVSQISLPVWGDDSYTTEIDGALANEPISFQLVNGTDLYNVEMPVSVLYVTDGLSEQTTAPTVINGCPTLGCMDAGATNYNELATVDDYSCTYSTPIEYQLSTGWNIVGFTACEITPIEEAVNNALGNSAGISNTFQIIKDVRGKFWHSSLGEYSALTQLTPGEGYMMYVNGETTTVQFSAQYCNDITYQLNSGWNMVAFTGDENSDNNLVSSMNNALGNSAGIDNAFWVIKNVQGQFWSPQYSMLTNLTPGEAYMMYVHEGQGTTVSFTENSTQIFENNPGEVFDLPTTDNNMSVVFPEGTLSEFGGYELKAYAVKYFYAGITDEILGVPPIDSLIVPTSNTHVINEDGSAGIPVIGNDNFLNFDIAQPGDLIRFKILLEGEASILINLSPPIIYAANSIKIIGEYPYISDFLVEGMPVEFGCIDESYLEFNASANIDNGSCEIIMEEGCTDIVACNYNEFANLDDGTCSGLIGCLDNSYIEYSSIAECNNQELCVTTLETNSIWESLYYYAIDSAASSFAIDEWEDSLLLAQTILYYDAYLAYVLDSINYNYELQLAQQNQMYLDSTAFYFAIDALEDSITLANTIQNEAYLTYVLDSTIYNYELQLALQNQLYLDSIHQVYNDIDSLILYNNYLLDELTYWSSSILINLVQGWNIIGYTSKEPQDVVATLQGIEGIILIVKNNAAEVYWPEFGFNGIGNLIPGQGYQIKVSEEYIGFTYPDVNGERIELTPTVPQWAIDIQVDLHPNDIRTLVKVVNMLGQEVNPETQSMGTILLYLYNDATVEKMMTK